MAKLLCFAHIAIISLIYFSVFVSSILIYNSVNSKELPDCNANSPTLSDIVSRELFFISTLDGKISAVDPSGGGRLVWSQETEPGELLSSTISRLEIPHRGKWARLIPSLDGSLYKFDGDTIEPVPISAETLLKSSFKFGDDTVITGGKENRYYGINVNTGKVKYKCAIDGCITDRDSASNNEYILVVRRETQTIRAIEPRSGAEKWNFSVGNHDLSIVHGLEEGCGRSESSEQLTIEDDTYITCDNNVCNGNIMIKVVMPDGFIGGVENSSVIKWFYKFDSPIVKAWKLENGVLTSINLFASDSVDLQDSEGKLIPPPLLYIGVHQKQVYIQKSAEMEKNIGSIENYMISSDLYLPRIEFKPYLLSAPSRTPSINIGKNNFLEDFSSKPTEISTILLLRNDPDYPYDTGYYLYGSTNSIQLEGDNTSQCINQKAESEEHGQIMEDTFDQIIIVSLWHWWREVLIISITTSLLVNLLIHICKRMRNKSSIKNCSVIQIVETTLVTEPSATEAIKHVDIVKTNEVRNCEFESRYLQDFEPLQCLGKGGFGVVFEARNKIDDCSYAVKRICLPNREDAREKVMREVKALAKLDHYSIVRYFNAWLECPPDGWQEEKDKFWEDSCKHSTVYSSSTHRSTAQVKGNHLNKLNPLKPFEPFVIGGTTESTSRIDIKHDVEENSLSSLKKEQPVGSSGSFEVIFDHSDKNTENSILSNNFDERNLKNIGVKKDKHFLFKNANITDSDYKASYEDSGCDEHNKIIYESDSENIENDKNTLNTIPFLKENKRPNKLDIWEKKHAQRPRKLYLYIQMQLCRKESLKDWIIINNAVRDKHEVLDIFDQIASAVQYVHENGLMHRDLKPSNIFFSMDGTVKVGDFGLVTAMTENDAHTPAEILNSEDIERKTRHTDQVGTQLYMSPEQILGHAYSHKVDIFSLGMILFELLVPFSTSMERGKILSLVRKQIYPESFKLNHPEECLLLTSMLSPVPEKRPSALEIKENSLFIEFHPRPEVIARSRRKTISQRLSSSSSDCELLNID